MIIFASQFFELIQYFTNIENLVWILYIFLILSHNFFPLKFWKNLKYFINLNQQCLYIPILFLFSLPYFNKILLTTFFFQFFVSISFIQFTSFFLHIFPILNNRKQNIFIWILFVYHYILIFLLYFRNLKKKKIFKIFLLSQHFIEIWGSLWTWNHFI